MDLFPIGDHVDTYRFMNFSLQLEQKKKNKQKKTVLLVGHCLVNVAASIHMTRK